MRVDKVLYGVVLALQWVSISIVKESRELLVISQTAKSNEVNILGA